MDIRNMAEMNQWNDYIKTITSSRRTHYEILTRETIHDRQGVKVAELPMENFSLDISSIDMYNNDVGQESAQKFMK
jgi:hypothetical protein